MTAPDPTTLADRLNTVADTVLCKLHDDFAIHENVISNPFIPPAANVDR